MIAPEYTSRLQLARQISVKAGEITLKYFQTDRFEVHRKQDGSPLTIADKEAETFLRAEIQAAFPDDAIVGEEFGTTEGTSGFCWVLDPIDGTKSFISGVPLYGTMVAVVKENETDERRAVIGAIYLPGLNEGIYASEGGGAWHFRGKESPVPARVSQNGDLSNAVFTTSEVEAFGERGASETYQRLAQEVFFARTWGDVYGYFLVATGRIDAMIDPILNIWDAAAVQPIIVEAGGQFTDWRGRPRIDAGESIGSNGLIHQDILNILQR